MNKFPNLNYEKSLWKKGYLVIGIDEVGRGCLAGPVTVGAVCFKKIGDINNIIELENIGINDSKKLTHEKRKTLYSDIQKRALLFSTATINVAIINKKGLVAATQMAVRQAIKNIKSQSQNNYKFFVLADAFYIKYIRGVGLKNQKAIIHGDEISISIAAASIMAKVTRDKLMKRLSYKYPLYKWGKNKGYGTADHIKAIKKHGKTLYHRELFIRNII